MSVAENSKFISLVADNGTEFTSEQKAIFNIHPDIGFMKGKDSYLSFDILNTCPESRPCNFPSTAGASSVIDRMDIYSLANGQLLESLTNYNLWCSIENQYLEEDNTHSQIKLGTDGVSNQAYKVTQNSGTKANTLVERGYCNGQGGTTSDFERSTLDIGSMIFSQIKSGTGVVTNVSQEKDVDVDMGQKNFTARKFCIPLKAGIFSHFGVAEKLTPILLFGGLRVEITFAEDKKVMQQLNVASSDTTSVKAQSWATGIPCDATVTTAIDAASSTALNLRTIRITNPISDPATLGIVRGANMTISQAADGTGDQAFKVVAVRRVNSGGGTGTIPNNKVLVTLDADIATAFATAANNRLFFTNASTQSTYKLKNVELKVLQVIPPKAMMKSIIKESQFDFISWDCFLDNLPSSSLSHQSDITSVASAAKCIFTHYISVGHETKSHYMNYYNGQPPHNTNLNSVQYFINNKLYPLNAYNPQAKEDKVVNMNEVVKAFSAIGKQVKRLGDCRAGGICDYTNTYLHARELARGEQFVYNLKDAEPQIRMGFSGDRTAAATGGSYALNNCRIINWVFSVKTIMINKDNLQLIL